ncbi:MAG: type II toxin-antitoxin system VapC family toxin [Gemmatimonadetes bacterium]|nr:type II toxin-antitoxin system VapC family toxin [Gemmatimonadota bacterium]
MIVADSDVLIDALRGRDPAATRVEAELEAGSLATTAVTVFELLSGARSGAAREKVERLLAPLAILPFDKEAGRAASEIRRKLDAAGTRIGMADYLIAGVCVSRAASLLTRNRAHFDRVPGLAVADLSGSGS